MIEGGVFASRGCKGNMLVKTILKKSSAKAALAITAAKRQEVAALRNAV
jgi:hypothetical protein